MKIVRNLFLSAFVFVLFQSVAVYATIYEMVITDYELQTFLAHNGIGVLAFYQESDVVKNNNNSSVIEAQNDNKPEEVVKDAIEELNQSPHQKALFDGIKKILTQKCSEFRRPLSPVAEKFVNFPCKLSEIGCVIHQILTVPMCIEHESNNSNQKFFCEQLEGADQICKKDIFVTVVADPITGNFTKKLALVDFANAFCDVIFPYFNIQKKETSVTPGADLQYQAPHLYVKLILDTEQEKITLITNPNQLHDGFTRIYDFENNHKVKKDDKCLIS